MPEDPGKQTSPPEQPQTPPEAQDAGALAPAYRLLQRIGRRARAAGKPAVPPEQSPFGPLIGEPPADEGNDSPTRPGSPKG